MSSSPAASSPQRQLIEVPGGVMEVHVAGAVDPDAPVVCAAHPGAEYGAGAAALLHDLSGAGTVCINPRGLGGSSPESGTDPYGFGGMIDDFEAVRARLGIGSWTFWGMSGGAWLAMTYALRYPASLAGMILESGCACFREVLADPTSVLSPFHASWRPTLEARGLVDPASHRETGDASATEWLEVEGIAPVFRRRGGPALLVSAVPATPRIRAAMPVLWSLDFRPMLSGMRTRALVVAGSADDITPAAHARALHDAIAGSTWLMVDGGHVPTTGRSPAVGDAVRAFLAGSQTTPSARSA